MRIIPQSGPLHLGKGSISEFLCSAGILKIPLWGSEFYTIAGPADIIGQVLLAPGRGLTKQHRRLAEAHPIISCSIRADAEPWRAAPSADEFHPITLRWGIYSANKIAIWSAPFPQFAEEVGMWSERAVDEGARFRTIIETTAARAADWANVVRKWKRRATEVQF